MDAPGGNPRHALAVLRHRYQETIEDPGSWEGPVEGMPVRITPPDPVREEGLTRGMTIAVMAGDARPVINALVRPGITGAWQAFDTMVATWIRPVGHPDIAQLTTLVARGTVPWFHDIEEASRYHVIVPEAVIEHAGRVDWHAWRARLDAIVSRPSLATPVVPWRDARDPPGIAIDGPIFAGQLRFWIVVLDPSPAHEAAIAALACCFPVATVIKGTGTLHARGMPVINKHYLLIEAMLPGKGILSAIEAIGATLAGKLDLASNRYVVVPPAVPVHVDLPPGYPDDARRVFSKDPRGTWNVVPSMKQGRCLTLAEQWEAMRR